jgi:hypothetical protein
MARTKSSSVGSSGQSCRSGQNGYLKIYNAANAFQMQMHRFEARSIPAPDGYSLDEHDEADAIRSQGGMA